MSGVSDRGGFKASIFKAKAKATGPQRPWSVKCPSRPRPDQWSLVPKSRSRLRSSSFVLELKSRTLTLVLL